MRMKRFDISPTKLKVGVMTGGIREDKPQLELNMGDLIKGTNYQEIDGVFSGYQSLAGIESFDGTALASSVSAPLSVEGVYDDAAREVRRAAIKPVGDTACVGPVLGLYNHVDGGVVYAVRKGVGAGATDLLYKSSGTGWVNIPTTAPAVLGTDEKYKFTEGTFDLLTGRQRVPTVFFASTGFFPSYIHSNTIVPIISADLPDSIASNIFATSIIEFKNRLWLGYPDGRLYFSNVGDPLDFDPTTFSGVIYREDEIVYLMVTTGDSLVVFCKNSIQLVKALSVGDVADQSVVDYLFSNVTLSPNIGAVERTANVVFDDLLYIDKRGLASIGSTQSYGDFETKSYSKGINKTLLGNYSSIVGASVVKEYNQYRLYFSNGYGIIFTFTIISNASGSSGKKMKGITTFSYPVTISCCTEGYIGCSDGLVLKIESGTSFNGGVISTTLNTSYHHYNSPTTFKRFREVFFEGYIPFNTTFTT